MKKIKEEETVMKLNESKLGAGSVPTEPIETVSDSAVYHSLFDRLMRNPILNLK